MDDDRIKVIVTEVLNSKLAHVQYKNVCEEKHKEVSTLRTMLWSVIVLQLTLLGGIITMLLRGLVK